MDATKSFERFNGNPAVAETALRTFSEATGVQLPQQYLAFLRHNNGGEGFIGSSYVIFFRLEELQEMNEGYGIDEFVPGLFLIGSDGGGEAIAFDLRKPEKPVVLVPFIGMDESTIVNQAANFDSFLERLYLNEELLR